MTELERRKIQRQMFALEDEKEAVEARYRFLLEQAQVGIFRMSRNSGEVLEANNEAIQMFHCDNFFDLKQFLSPSNPGESRFVDPMQFQNMENGDAVSFSMHATKKDGESFWARVILQRLNHIDYLEGIISDISEQVRMDIELRKAIVSAENARKDAEEANKAKSDFLANISHEIRTPLNGIIGFTEIIMASIDSPEGHLYAGKILDESDNLMTLINQLLDISKIEAKQLQLNKEPFYLRNLLAETISFIRLRARNKGLKLSVQYDEKLPVCILGDSYRLRQILLNLLSNALKFTSLGEISLSAYLEMKTGEELTIRFEVKDTGIGIPASMHDAIFESFVQADSSISRQYGGSGLGISISRELVEIMGGNIWFESRENVGTTFYFTIKSRKVEAFNPDDPATGVNKGVQTRELNGASVLIVEDYPTNREIAQHHLESVGCLVDMAPDGFRAIQAVQENHYDLILMDVHMPDMNGLDATRKIREMDICSDTPIIGMTANVMPANRQECKAAGMADFIPKPLRKRELLETLEYWYTHKLGSPRNNNPEEEKPDSGNALLYPFDFYRFLEDMDGDRSGALEIIYGFLGELDRQMGLIEKALAEENWEMLHREAHSIKGGAMNLGAEELSEWAMALERAAGDIVLSVIPLLLRNLKQAVETLKSYCVETLPSL